jgi:hypothetical protein
MIDEYFTDRPKHLGICPVFKSSQRRSAGQIGVASNSSLKTGVFSQCIMIVEIFVAKAQTVDSLSQQALLLKYWVLM